MSLSRSLYLCRHFFPSWDTPSRSCTHTLSPHFKLIPIAHTLLVSLSHMHSVLLFSPSLSHKHGFFATTSKMPMRCMEHQDAFVWVLYLVGEKDERGKALSANVVKSAGKMPYFPSYPSDINRTTYIAGWQAHHHHQLYFLSLLL